MHTIADIRGADNPHFHPAADTTARLLIELSRPNPPLEVLYALLQGGVDWVDLVEQAERHSLAPLLFWCLSRMRPGVASPEIFEQLRRGARACAQQSLRHAAALHRVLAAFETRAIPVMALKGPVSAWSLYPNPGLRQMVDLDLLVKPEDALRAVGALIALGCKPLGPSPATALGLRRYQKEREFVTPEGVFIDLHWQLGTICFERWFDAVWSRTTNARIAGRLVPVLGREDRLRFLCVHAAKDGWIRLRDLSDLARLIALGVDCDAALSEADRSGGVRTLLLGLGLLRDILGETLPAHVNRRIAAEPGMRKLLASAKRTLLAASLPAGSIAESLRRCWSLLERPADRARLCWGLMQPSALDWEWCPLPPSLHGLYFLLKPIRLAGKYLVPPSCRRS